MIGRFSSDGPSIGDTIRLSPVQRSVLPTPTTPGHCVDCTALGPGEYTGHLDRNRFYAVGTIRVICDDGREATVKEVMSGSYPAPDGSHDT